jgi:hypothetical protein
VSLNFGKTLAFAFPGMKDPDPGENGIFVSLDLGSAKDFVTGKFPNLMIKPKKNPDHIGIFPIKVTIKDDNKLPQTATYSLDLVIKGEKVNASSSSANKSVPLLPSVVLPNFVKKANLNKNLKTNPI